MEGEKYYRTILCQTPLSIPFAYQEKLKTELNFQGIIDPVTDPPKWCAPITPKKNTDNILMPIMTKQLGETSISHTFTSSCWHHSTQSNSFDQIGCNERYHKCPLDEESQLLKTLSYHLAISSTCGPQTESHLSLSTTIVKWKRHLLGSLGTGA